LAEIAALDLPVVDIGPYGKGAHQRGERLLMSRSYGWLPQLVHEVIERLADGETQTTTPQQQEVTAPDTAVLASALEAAMMEQFRQCWTQLRYRPTYVLQHLSEHGAIETARWVVRIQNESSGFIRLWEAQRLDLSIEALVLQPRFAALFSVEDRRLAYEALKVHGYVFPPGTERP
jgi:hypothetical protein